VRIVIGLAEETKGLIASSMASREGADPGSQAYSWPVHLADWQYLYYRQMYDVRPGSAPSQPAETGSVVRRASMPARIGSSATRLRPLLVGTMLVPGDAQIVSVDRAGSSTVTYAPEVFLCLLVVLVIATVLIDYAVPMCVRSLRDRLRGRARQSVTFPEATWTSPTGLPEAHRHDNKAWQITNSKQQTTSNKQQATSNKQQATSNKRQTTRDTQEATINTLQTTNAKQQSTHKPYPR